MSKTKRLIAAVTAAIITATSASLMSVCAEGSEAKKADSVSAPQSDTEKSILQEYADDISSYMMMNSLAGYAFVRDDKVVVTYSAYVDKIKFYVDAKRMDKSVIIYEAARNVGETPDEEKNSTLSDIAEDINEYMRTNGISGYTYVQTIGGTEKKLLIVFDGFLDKIKAYVAEKGIDESLVEYSQSRDDVIVSDKTDEEKTAVQKYAEAICDFMANNDIQGVVSRDVPDEKLSIGFHGDHEAQLRAYISEIGLDKSGIPYEFEKLPDFSEFYDLNVTTATQTSAAAITTTSVTTLPATTNSDTEMQKPLITINDITRLSKKGDALTWSDFEKYKHTDVGSGLYVWEFEIDKCNAKLKIGGGNLEEKPDYIKITMWTDVDVDVRTEDLYRWFGYGGAQLLKGDANCDGTVDMADIVLIMQALANPNKYGENGTDEYHLTPQGKANADMDGDGLTVGDAQAIQKKLLGLDVTNSSQSTDKEQNINVVGQDVGFGQKWNGKPVSYELYTVLNNTTDESTVIAVYPQFKSSENYKCNGKTIAEYSEDVSSNKLLDEKLHQILKDGDELKYGELLYTTGTPDGEKWAKELYEQRVGFYGEKFLAKYIVNGEFLIDKVEEDIKDFSNAPHNALAEALKAYKKAMIKDTIEQLKQQNIGYEYREASDELIINVTSEEFKSLSLENVLYYCLASTSSDYGFVSTSGANL